MATAPQSPIDTLVQAFGFGYKPGMSEAIHTALEGVDLKRLDAFNGALRVQMTSFPLPSANAAILNALRSTNGTNNDTNVQFAKKIQASVDAVDSSPNVFTASVFDDFPPTMRPRDTAQIAQFTHDGLSGVSRAIGRYIKSTGSLEPPAAQNGRRRHFNKAQLTEAQHIAAGTATAAEVRDVQRELKGEGFRLGKFGKNHDGVDSIAGQHTLGAMARATKKSGILSP